MVWPTLGSRTAKEQNRTEPAVTFELWSSHTAASMLSLDHCDLQRHMGMDNLPEVVTQQRGGREPNSQPSSRDFNAEILPKLTFSYRKSHGTEHFQKVVSIVYPMQWDITR